MRDNINVVIKKPKKAPEIHSIENTLESLQSIVGGFIEVAAFEPVSGVVMVLNEEGKLDDLPHNFSTTSDKVVGTVVFAADSGEDLTSLSKSQIEDVIFYFWHLSKLKELK